MPARSATATAVLAGLITAVVGFTSSFAVVLAGLRAVGASTGQAASGLLTLCVVMGVTGIVLSRLHRMPISIAWSTPGAALLSSTAWTGGFGHAVGAFLISGALALISGLWSPLCRMVTAIPAPVASALLGGVLLELCLAPIHAVRDAPRYALPVVAVWLVLSRVARRWAVPGSFLAAVLAVAIAPVDHGGHPPLAPHLVFTGPEFSIQAVTLGISLFIVTMASQNVPGVAVMAACGYDVPLSSALRSTGIGSMVGAISGGHMINLAAISAALCAGPDAHPDKDRRWIAAASAGACYVLFGLGAGAVISIVSSAPPHLIEAVAGLALLGTLGGALATATADPLRREAPVVTFVVTASGVTFGGIGSALWGLLAGLVVTFVLYPRTRKGPAPR